MSVPATLFTPIRIGDLTLPNRVIMAPLTRRRAAAGKVPTALSALYYAQRASAGLIVSESTEVDPIAGGPPPTRPGIFSEAQVAGWRLVTDAVHAEGGRIFIQLSHLGRASHPSMRSDGSLPVAPSAIGAGGTVFTPIGPQPYPIPRALDLAEIPTVVAQFAAAADNARRAGFDGVEIHGANGYLIDEFLRDGSNRRTDRYGGSVENRARLLLEITAAVVAIWGAGRVAVRLSPWNSFGDMHDSNPAAIFSHVAAALAPFGLAYLHVIESPPGHSEAPAVPLAPDLGKLFGGPLLVAGGYDQLSAEQAIAAGTADFVAFGEAFIANPDLPARFRRGARLNQADKATFYAGGERGYTDYPFLTGQEEAVRA
jgi:N-ethylmaleimide reductase